MQIGFLNGKGRSDRENQACGTAGAGYGQYAVKYFKSRGFFVNDPRIDARPRGPLYIRVSYTRMFGRNSDPA